MNLNRGGFVLTYNFRDCSVGSSRPIGFGAVETACRVGSTHGGRGPFNSQLEQREKEQAHVLDPPQRHTPSDWKISC